MPRKVKQFFASLCASAILAVAVVSPAAAQNQDQDGLVNVAIGNIVVQDVNVGVAAIVAATVCGVKVGPVAVLGQAVDRTGTTDVICTRGSDSIELRQN